MKKLVIIFILLLVVVGGMLWFLRGSGVESETIFKDRTTSTTLYFLDVGQGDATLINFENGQQMLVDCGRDAKVLEELGRVMDFNDKKIDYLVVTHPDNDHYGGCIDVLDRFEVGRVVYNGQQKPEDELWKTFWEAVRLENGGYHLINGEEKWYIGYDELHFLFPDGSSILNIGDNNKSVVFILKSGEYKVLFTGDAEEKLETYLEEKYGDKLDVDILKVGHHGSDSSSGQEFLDLVTPLYSIIPVGKNKYGHPSLRVIRRLEREGGKVFRTDVLSGVKAVLGEEIKILQI